MLCLGIIDMSLTSWMANWEALTVPEGLRPFQTQAHVVYKVYFKTAFAYFQDVIKRTLGAVGRRYLNPVGQENFF